MRKKKNTALRSPKREGARKGEHSNGEGKGNTTCQAVPFAKRAQQKKK